MNDYAIDSSDDEEEYVVRKIENGYFPHIIDALINVTDILTTNEPAPEFDYRLGITLQHMSDRFFRHTDLGEKYKELKLKYITEVKKEDYKQFIKQARLFFTSQNLLALNAPFESKHVIQLFNHIFSDRVPLPQSVQLKEGIEAEYKKLLLIEIRKDAQLVRIINNIFPHTMFSLEQSEGSKNASEVLSFSKLINRYMKNELKAILVSSPSSIEVDKFVHLRFQRQTIRDLNESWILRPQTKKAQNKIDSLENYSDIFKDLTETNKQDIINHILAVLNNMEIQDTPNEHRQYADKLTQLLFVTELVRNKAAIFTTLMFVSLLKEKNISKDSDKSKLINLFPMSSKGAIQSSRDLVNEDKLENTHYMDFNHEGMAHVSMLEAQGELWRSYDTKLEIIRKVIILLHKDSRESLTPDKFLEYIIATKEFLPAHLVTKALEIQEQYQTIMQGSLDFQKQHLKTIFPDSVKLIEDSTTRTITKVITKLFNQKVTYELMDKHHAVFESHNNFINSINKILSESIMTVYRHTTEFYMLQGFDETKFKLIGDLSSMVFHDDKSIKLVEREVLSNQVQHPIPANQIQSISGSKRPIKDVVLKEATETHNTKRGKWEVNQHETNTSVTSSEYQTLGLGLIAKQYESDSDIE